MELHEALSQISEIRQQMARTAVFRGYRSATAAFSAVVAVGAAVAQSVFVPVPKWDIKGYLAVWLIAALLGVAAAAVEMISRCVRSRSPLQKEMTVEAAEQFLPCLAGGALLTLVLALFAHDAVWLLPGLWAMLFSLGVFASRRVLPKAVAVIAGYYMIAGLLCIALCGDDPWRALSPWMMGGIFGTGQALSAVVLYWTLEREHGRS